ncbi:MAG: hypothetical protein C0475_09180 [Planctomyces sp.]|nr:hypothetical protein [Planctomyces sp.]MBA4040064.1 hypothetical protein [Planctomyces sp.]
MGDLTMRHSDSCARAARWVCGLAGAAIGAAALLGGAAGPALALGSVHADAAAQPAGNGRVRIGWVELEGELKERADGLAGIGPQRPTLRTVTESLAAAAKDPSLRGLVIRLKDAQLGSTQVEEIGQAIAQLRASGKSVHVYAESYGPAEFLLGSYADEALIQTGGGVALPGLTIEEMYMGDMLRWAGASPDFVQVGDYKGASEPIARGGPSPEWDQNINGLLDSLYGALRDRLKEGRKLSDAQLDAAMEACWMGLGSDAIAHGLLDAQVELPDLDERLGARHGGKVAWDRGIVKSSGSGLDTSNPFALLSALSRPVETTPTRPTIAVVHIDGAIIDGDSSPGGLTGGASVGSRTIRRALSAIEDQDLIKGVIVRVNSPGGSATASEVIWQGVRRVAAKKPVWVSVGNMAASGGYYIASAGQRILVNPSSIVGSIGVVGGKIGLGGALEALRINTVVRARGPRADMFTLSKPWDEDQRRAVRAKMQEVYDLFAARVTAGRAGIDLSKTAEGRLFAGQRAVGMKLADAVGDLNASVRGLASAVSLADGSYDVMDYPAPKSLEEVLEDLFKAFGVAASAPGAGLERSRLVGDVRAAGAALLGERAWGSIAGPLEAFLQLRTQPVILASPTVLIVR